MNRLIILIIVLICYGDSLRAQKIEYSQPVNTPESCTSIMVGKKASADGSVMTSHTCDGNYRTWMEIVPAARYEHDTTVAIYNGRMHTEYPADRTNMELKGTIPEARSTYQFLNTSYPCLNEKQLGIGETTISGRKELQNKKGMFMIEELEKIALQRCTTAREAIRLIGQLVAEYGYGDSGECLTIADPNEVWHFEVFGEGPDKVGGVWAAVRIPDDHVGVSANISRISTLDLKDKGRYMASENVFSVAKKMGFWDGKEPFKFWKAYSGGNYFGEPKSFSIREYFILNALAGIGQSCMKFATDLRLLANFKEMEEPFEKNQIGSSAMPYKRNPMRCERICALSRYLMVDVLNPSFTTGTQWFERTLDDSANKRVAMAEGFLATDAILNIMLNVTDGIVVYPKVVRSRLMAELPFMASENIMMQAVEKGGNRQELHERLRQHAIAAGKQVKEEGLPNDMVDRVAADPAFGLTKEEIAAGLVPENFVGRAPQQVEEFIAHILKPIFDTNPDAVEQHADLSV